MTGDSHGTRSDIRPGEKPDKEGQLSLKEKVQNVKDYFASLEDYERRKGGRTHYRIILSFDVPATNEQIRDLTNKFLEQAFSKAIAFAAIHRDTEHPHVHLYLNSRQFDGKRIQLKNTEFKTIDEKWATIYSDFAGDKSVYIEYMRKKEETRAWKIAAAEDPLKNLQTLYLRTNEMKTAFRPYGYRGQDSAAQSFCGPAVWRLHQRHGSPRVEEPMKPTAHPFWLMLLFAPLLANPASRTNNSPTSVPTVQLATLNKYYESLVTGASSASGTLRCSFQGGPAKTSAPGTLDIDWIVPPNTWAICEFDYQPEDSKHWKKLSFSFERKAVTALFRQGRVDARRQEISRIEFRPSGEPLEYYDATGVPIGDALSQFPEIRRHLKIPVGLQSLFFGTPFVGVSGEAISQNGLRVQQITIPQSQGTRAVSLTLAQQAAISLVDTNTGGKGWLRLLGPTSVSIKSLLFDTTAGLLEGTAGPVTFSVADGHIEAGSTILNLSRGSVLTFSQTHFWSNISDGPDALEASSGSLSGKLGQGSMVEVANGLDGRSVLETNTEETVLLQDLSVSGNKSRSSIKVGQGQFPISGAAARIPLGAGNFFRLRFKDQPLLSMLVQKAEWYSDQPLTLTASIPAFDASLTDGQMVFNTDTTIELAAGKVASTGLSLNYPSNHPGTGTFTKIDFAIADRSTFGLGAHRLLLGLSGGSGSTTDGITFTDALDGPQGHFLFSDLSVSGGELAFGSHGAVKLVSGKVDLDIVRGREIDGKWSGKLVNASGTIRPDSQNSLQVQHGSIEFDTQVLTEAAGISGPFKSLKLEIAKSPIKLSTKFNALTADSGTLLVADDANAPLSLDPDGELNGKSHLTATLVDGTLTPLIDSHVQLLSGSRLDALFDLRGTQPAKADLSLDLRCGPGNLAVNQATNAPITGGSIVGNHLTYLEPDSLSGRLGKVSLATGPTTTIFPNALLVSSEAPGGVSGGDSLQQGSAFDLGGCIKLKLSQPVKTGIVKLGKDSNANVVGGTLDTLETICPGQPVKTTITLDVIVSNGLLKLNGETTLSICGTSHLKASALTVSNDHGLTGSISDLDIAIGESLLSMPRGFKALITKSHVVATAPAQQLTIDDTGTSMYGTVVVDGQMEQFYNADPTAFQLHGGSVHLVLTQGPNGHVEGHDMSVQGATMDLVISDPPLSLPLAVDLTNGQFAGDPGQDSTLSISAKAVTTIPIKIDKQSQNDCTGDRDSGLTFPVAYSVTIPPNTGLLSGTIIFAGNNIQLPALNQTLGFTITVAQGLGEHEHERCHGEEGWGEMAPDQEVFTNWIPGGIGTIIGNPGGCRFHFYVLPHEYSHATANLRISYNNLIMSMSLSGVDLHEDLATDHAGCWPVGALFESVMRSLLQDFGLAGVSITIKHDLNPPKSTS